MSNMMTAAEAFRNARFNKHRLINKESPTNDGLAVIPWEAKFEFGNAASFFTIGSCFARNVENYLLKAGRALLSQMPPLPNEYFIEDGAAMRSGYQNVYTPGSMLEIIKMAEGHEPAAAIVGENDQYLDLMTSGLHPLPLSEVQKIRSGLVQQYRRLAEAEVVLITLGYNEAWRHIPSDAYINRTPAHPILRRREKDFEFAILDFAQTLGLLEEAVARLKTLSPKIRIIFTVSPVPLTATFSDRHIYVANQRSKATLLAAAHKLAERHAFVDYFPSYDIVMNSAREVAFIEDGVHVRPKMVEYIMKNFFESYFGKHAGN